MMAFSMCLFKSVCVETQVSENDGKATGIRSSVSDPVCARIAAELYRTVDAEVAG